ncbi:3-deoxy-D-manno-octulosonic acid transferase [Beijerinckia sp. L45]|uniref:3-deoxy-D-manno-octulosonic acid transferase n=1 Tax=Beijerinckia sp. L45 TaxID=1641855 RepID=UPI00131E0FDA|nr:glycosyltransferase N-terminal domain-containing protein [Beijerinckia sp. L45]
MRSPTSALLLPIYWVACKGLGFVLPPVLQWRSRKSREARGRCRERMGWPSRPRPEGRLAWLQSETSADAIALLPLLDQLTLRGFEVLVSTRSLAAAKAVKARLPAGSFHHYMPLDVPRFVARFLDHWRPDLVLVAGSTLWPNLLDALDRRALPLVLVDAHLSDRAFARWCRVPALAASLMQRIDLCLARSTADAERLAALGTRFVQVAGDPVLDAPAPTADPLAVSTLAGRIGARPVWVAALTHVDEDDLILGVHEQLLERYTDLVTILVPRQAAHGPTLAARAAARVLSVALHSRGGVPAHLPCLYIVDDLRELGVGYRAAGLVFLGRSLSDPGGGRNPVDAAKLGCAILHGPNVEAFESIYGVLDAAEGAARVDDADLLVRVLSLLFEDGAKLRLMQRHAAQAIDQRAGATARIMQALEPHIVQIELDTRKVR